LLQVNDPVLIGAQTPLFLQGRGRSALHHAPQQRLLLSGDLKRRCGGRIDVKEAIAKVSGCGAIVWTGTYERVATPAKEKRASQSANPFS
jgi:hypothetical protein